MCICMFFGWKISFLGKIGKNFGKNIQNFLVTVVVGRWTTSNKLNGVVMFSSSALSRKYPVLVILIQKIKIFCLKWKFVARLTCEYAEFDGNVDLYVFGSHKIFFHANLVKKNLGMELGK